MFSKDIASAEIVTTSKILETLFAWVDRKGFDVDL